MDIHNLKNLPKKEQIVSYFYYKELHKNVSLTKIPLIFHFSDLSDLVTASDDASTGSCSKEEK